MTYDEILDKLRREYGNHIEERLLEAAARHVQDYGWGWINIPLKDIKLTDTTEDAASRLATLIMDAIETNRHAGTPGITRTQIMDAYHVVGGMGQGGDEYLPELPKEAEDAEAIRVIVTSDDVATLSIPGLKTVYYSRRGDAAWRPVCPSMEFRWEHHENLENLGGPTDGHSTPPAVVTEFKEAHIKTFSDHFLLREAAAPGLRECPRPPDGCVVPQPRWDRRLGCWVTSPTGEDQIYHSGTEWRWLTGPYAGDPF